MAKESGFRRLEVEHYYSADNDPPALTQVTQNEQQNQLDRLTQEYLLQGGAITSPVEPPAESIFDDKKDSWSKTS